MGKITTKIQSKMGKPMKWSIEKRKQGNEIWITSNVKDSDPDIFIGEGYDKKERARSNYLADIIVKALNSEDFKNGNEH